MQPSEAARISSLCACMLASAYGATEIVMLRTLACRKSNKNPFYLVIHGYLYFATHLTFFVLLSVSPFFRLSLSRN